MLQNVNYKWVRWRMFGNRNSLGWFGKQLDKHIKSLEFGDYSSISWIFCVFSEPHAATKELAAKALCEALGKMTFDDIVRVDEQMRQKMSMEWSINWRQFSLQTFFTPKMSEPERRAVIVFASFNPDGFIRERAIRQMKDYPGTLPFALLRQNDWVQQVRDASIETTDYRLGHLSRGELLSALPFADKLSRSGRLQNPSSEIKKIFIALTGQINEDDLLEGLKSENIRTRRICTDALFTAEAPKYDFAFECLQSERDPFLRAGIFRRLMSAGQDMGAAAGRFMKDRYPLNRIFAFRYICDTDHKASLQTALTLLLDKSAMVREKSRDYLTGQQAGLDYRTFYKSKLDTKTVPAILGLGETGKADDAAELEGYLKSPRIAVVRAAMTAVMRLNGARYLPKITDFLTDKRTGVVKTAGILILKTDAPDYARIMDIFKRTQFITTKRKCFSVLMKASKWQRLIYILDVLEAGGTEMEEQANDALSRWILTYNGSYANASRDQIQSISGSITRLDRKLPEKVRTNLRFLLR